MIGGRVNRQQHRTEWAEHSDLDSQVESGKRMKIDRNVMNCLGILSAILPDIGLQFRGDIIPKLPTAPVEGLSRTQSHPINDTKSRKQMVWGDIATCDEKPPIPVLFWFNIVEILLLAIKPDFNSILARGEVFV